MGLKALAEGIILQSIDDLWDRDLRNDSVAFFKSNDFSLCAEMAGMELADQVKLLTLVKGVVAHSGKKADTRKTVYRQRQVEKKQRRPREEAAASCA